MNTKISKIWNKKLWMVIAVAFLMSCGGQAKFSSVDTNAFARVIAMKKVQLVDVRTPAEYANGHIPHAINMNVNDADFEAQAAQLNKARPVAIYCRSGNRSKRAANLLTNMGYKVVELDAGYLGWVNDGRLVE